ncbi:hypothetical protein SAMN02745163_00829 [Clostridium cavendishii DSM 21758]|uniref:Uncharacterized protein n=1 Tax=Clostridium cavendishii DSM 21758 TaxID=1121302 RepID=A0A1M6EDR9_9CLOT|nr:hypothetical protein [Clostridium cavendishii]SHI83626.1 hypothetical protein SAMN02745163_00829 [Clostridium cavendishii DSM 21758]
MGKLIKVSIDRYKYSMIVVPLIISIITTICLILIEKNEYFYFYIFIEK